MTNLDEVLKNYVPEKERAEVKRILYGNPAQTLQLPESAQAIAKKLDFDLVGYKIGAAPEELRHPRIVRIGAIQNAIKAPTTAPVAIQLQAIHDWAREIIHAAHLSGVNVLGL